MPLPMKLRLPILKKSNLETHDVRCSLNFFFFFFQTVSSFIKDTFHKQSWYFRQDMGRQSLTVYNFQTPFFNGLPKSESHYKTQ